jgi:hypothetical protein
MRQLVITIRFKPSDWSLSFNYSQRVKLVYVTFGPFSVDWYL